MKLRYSISVLDETLANYGDVSALFHFLELNPNYEILDVISANTEFNVDDFRIPVPISTLAGGIQSSNPNIEVIVMENQTLFDISTRYYGDVSKILQLMIDNQNIDNINQKITGKTLLINNVNNSNANVIFFNNINSILTTGFDLSSQLQLLRAFNKSFSLAFH